MVAVGWNTHGIRGARVRQERLLRLGDIGAPLGTGESRVRHETPRLAAEGHGSASPTARAMQLDWRMELHGFLGELRRKKRPRRIHVGTPEAFIPSTSWSAQDPVQTCSPDRSPVNAQLNPGHTGPPDRSARQPAGTPPERARLAVSRLESAYSTDQPRPHRTPGYERVIPRRCE